MINVSSEIIEDFTSNQTKELTLVIDNSTTIGMNDIYFESQKLEQSICESEELLFGKVSAASYQVKAKATTFSHKGKKLIPTIKTEHGEFQLGEFYIESDKLTSDKKYRDIVAYDAIYNISKTDITEWFNNKKGSKKTLKQLRNEFFDFIGIQQRNIVLPNDDIVVEMFEVDNMNALDFIQMICEINGCFGQMDNLGVFKYVFIKPTYLLYPSEDLYPSENLYPNEDAYKINNLKKWDFAEETITQKDYEIGSFVTESFETKSITGIKVKIKDSVQEFKESGDNIYTIENNILLEHVSEEDLMVAITNFYNVVNNILYVPTRVKYRARPYLECGDYIRVVGERDISLFPILHRTISGINSMIDNVEAEGVEKYYDSDYRQSVSQKMFGAYAQEKVEKEISAYDKSVQALTTLMSQSFGVFKTEKVGADGSIIYYMHNKPKLEDSPIQWKFVSNALAVSSDYGKTWKAGIDASGNAVVNVLNAIGINADWIRAGTIDGINFTSTYYQDYYKSSYSDKDLERVDGIILKSITPDENDFDKYDLNRDGVIDIIDLGIIDKLIQGYFGDKYTIGIKTIISSTSRTPIQIYTSINGGEWQIGTKIGASLIESRRVSSNGYYGFTGSFKTFDNKTVEVKNGLIDGIY